MIPKIIHFCWFGGKPLTEKAEMCIASWKKFLPDYEIRRWDESNFDINISSYVKQAYEAQKWAFVADYFRFWVLYNYGGIYFDSDVEVVKSFDEFLSYDLFTGYESGDTLEAAVIGAVKNQPLIGNLLNYFDNREFLVEGKADLTPLPRHFTSQFVKDYGLIINSKKFSSFDDGKIAVYHEDWFSPMDYCTFKVHDTENTHCIHRFTNSWRTEEEIKKIKKIGKYQMIFGKKLGWYLANKGFFGTVKKVITYPFTKRRTKKH